MDEVHPGPPAPPHRTAEQLAWAQHLHGLRTPLTVALGRVYLMRRRLRRGDDLAQIDVELETLETALMRLAEAITRLDADRTDF